MDEIKARLKLTKAIMGAIGQGLTMEDIKKILKLRAEKKQML